MRAYTRTAGGIQWLYAGFVGWHALIAYSSGRFYHPDEYSKGFYPAHFDYRWLISITVFALLSATGFIGGYGLLRLRPWVRRWEVAYLSVLSVGVACIAIDYLLINVLWPLAELTYVVLVSMAIGLPYLPFLFGAVVGSVTETRLRQGPKKGDAVDASEGVSDRELDG